MSRRAEHCKQVSRSFPGLEGEAGKVVAGNRRDRDGRGQPANGTKIPLDPRWRNWSCDRNLVTVAPLSDSLNFHRSTYERLAPKLFFMQQGAPHAYGLGLELGIQGLEALAGLACR